MKTLVLLSILLASSAQSHTGADPNHTHSDEQIGMTLLPPDYWCPHAWGYFQRVSNACKAAGYSGNAQIVCKELVRQPDDEESK